MISLSLLLSVVVLGALAVPHCATMCACNFAQRWMNRGASEYQLGRFLAYTSMGALAGMASQTLVAIAWAGAPVFTALNWMLHAVLLFSAMLLVFTGKPFGSVALQAISLPVHLQARLHATPNRWQSFKAGLLWFLMPCGVLYAAVILAFLGGSAIQGAVLMAVFAVFTGTGMLAMRSARQWATRFWTESQLNRLSGVLILLALAAMVLRNLGHLPAPAALQSLGLCL